VGVGERAAWQYDAAPLSLFEKEGASIDDACRERLGRVEHHAGREVVNEPRVARKIAEENE